MSAPVALHFSHFGVFVRDLDGMTAFYRDFMGFIVTDRGHLPNAELTFLSRNPLDHHQIVLITGRAHDGSNPKIIHQISFRVESLGALKEFHTRLANAPVTDIEPINHGLFWSVYFRDPEGNRIEIFADTDWYITQPCRVPIDFALPAAQIYAQTKAYCEAQASCRPLAQWRADFTRRLTVQNTGDAP